MNILTDFQALCTCRSRTRSPLESRAHELLEKLGKHADTGRGLRRYLSLSIRWTFHTIQCISETFPCLKTDRMMTGIFFWWHSGTTPTPPSRPTPPETSTTPKHEIDNLWPGKKKSPDWVGARDLKKKKKKKKISRRVWRGLKWATVRHESRSFESGWVPGEVGGTNSEGICERQWTNSFAICPFDFLTIGLFRIVLLLVDGNMVVWDRGCHWCSCLMIPGMVWLIGISFDDVVVEGARLPRRK